MKKIIYTLALSILTVFGACQSTSKRDKKSEPENSEFTDWHSQSNGDKINAEHLDLAIEVDFDHKQIHGSATWTINPDQGIEEAIFDSQGIRIDSILYGDNSQAKFEVGEADPILGSPLKIELKEGVDKLKIYYKTSDESTALQWLEASQTFGGKSPYLYTQGEPIYGRTWIPGPDGPGYRFTYNARVKVPKGLLALMSAENPQEINEDGIYEFKMEQKIPLYLLALAVGDIEFKAVDDRTGVYAEGAILEKAHTEMENLDEMVKIAEDLYGKYRWDRYDVLILPSGFPMGGMENPRLTFATPTILAGDKSLLNLIAHELAHSWSGNLVTSATWGDLWLNEGFTVYIERRITEAEHGKEYTAMLWDLAEKKVDAVIERRGKDHKLTWLKQDLKDLDPEEAFTRIPYDKGAAFLLKIEQTVGREKWDEFLIDYFNQHEFSSMTTERFLDYLDEHLLNENQDWKDSIDVDAWIYGPGKPDSYPHVDNPRFEKVDAELNRFLEGASAGDLESDDWSTYEWLRFLGNSEGLSYEQMEDLDEVFDFTHTGNSEIANVWFIRSLKSAYTPAYGPMKEFLYVTGRAKFLVPLYEEMIKSEKGKEMAKEIYGKSKPNYHPITQKAIDRIVNEN